MGGTISHPLPLVPRSVVYNLASRQSTLYKYELYVFLCVCVFASPGTKASCLGLLLGNGDSEGEVGENTN